MNNNLNLIFVLFISPMQIKSSFVRINNSNAVKRKVFCFLLIRKILSFLKIKITERKSFPKLNLQPK